MPVAEKQYNGRIILSGSTASVRREEPIDGEVSEAHQHASQYNKCTADSAK